MVMSCEGHWILSFKVKGRKWYKGVHGKSSLQK